ncbi:MAG: carboxypeptidase-like regulatory domain-containing protein [Bdellovibrio sp.]|nr:carboxypeptidase-like regulatory domain-containing protein [Bdellovibrio sp.]
MPARAFVFFWFFLSTLKAQEAIQLHGRLWEMGTKKPLAQANLFILPYKLKATTNQKGEFSFSDVPKSSCQIIINISGYKKFEEKDLCLADQDNLNIYLEKISYTTFETTVSAKVIKRDDQSMSLTQEEFLKMPGSFGGDPVRAAQNLPGVGQSGASAQIIVQGAGVDDTAYTIDGHRVPNVFHFGGLSSIVSPESVEHIDFLPSGYGPEYGKAMGGVIGLSTKPPMQDRWHGMAFMDLLNTGAMAEGPLDEDKSSLLISGRYSYIGQVLKAVAKESDDFALTAAPTFYDVTSIYKRQINENNKFKTTFVASRDELELVLNKSAGNDTALRGDFENVSSFMRLIPQLSTDLDTHTKMENSLGLGRDAILFNINGRYLDIDAKVISHRSELVREWGPTYKTYIGLDNYFTFSTVKVNLPNFYMVGGVNNPFSVGDQRKFVSKEQNSELAAYLRQEIKTSADSKWTYLPNFRLDHFTVNSDTTMAPRFQVRYQWDATLLLRASIGQYVQPPLPQETSQYYGNPGIKSPYAIHYTTGFTKDFRQGTTQGLELTNNYFYKDLKRLVISDVQTNYANKGTGKIFGGEIQAKYRMNDWSSQIVYTYLHSRRTIPGYGTTPSEFDQTHNLNLIAGYNRGRWTYATRLRYVTGNPYTPIIASTYDSDNDVYIPTRGPLYSKRFDDFKSLDIRIDRKFIYDTWILTGYLDVQNLTNSKNSQFIEHSYDYSQSNQVNGLPILPTLGAKGEF